MAPKAAQLTVSLRLRDPFVVVSPSWIQLYVADATAIDEVASRRKDFLKPEELYSKSLPFGSSRASLTMSETLEAFGPNVDTVGTSSIISVGASEHDRPRLRAPRGSDTGSLQHRLSTKKIVVWYGRRPWGKLVTCSHLGLYMKAKSSRVLARIC